MSKIDTFPRKRFPLRRRKAIKDDFTGSGYSKFGFKF